MGYFSNGLEGLCYEEEWCMRCLHYGPVDGPGCPVMGAQLRDNYKECNNPESILHLLIPRTPDDLGNEQCSMFIKREGMKR